MPLSRRDALTRLAALAATMSALARSGWAQLESNAPDPLDGTIAQFQAGRRLGKWTSEEVTRQALERSRAASTRWRAIDVLSPTALDEARASDQRGRDGALLGPLDGVPLFAKSIYDMKGLPTTGSNAEWARIFPEPVRRDAVEVIRLRAAGAVVLGKTAADDFAFHGNGTSSFTGQVLNPYDPTGTRTPGGSSAGSAVSVATGTAFVGMGTDDGGSNRIPAQFTGVVGMKPTFGLLPRYGVIPTWPYLDTHGPLSRFVADSALVLAALAGPHDADPLVLTTPWNSPSPLELRDDALLGVRIGVVEANIPRGQMAPEAVAAWDRAVANLKAAGAIVDAFDSPVTAPNYEELFAAAARERGDVAVNDWTPPPTINALYLYFAGRSDDPRGDMRKGYPAFQAFYSDLPKTFEEAERYLEAPMIQDPAGQSFARSRASVVRQLTDAMRKAEVQAMVWPTMPFNATPIAGKWPKVRTTLSYNNWLGLPEVSVPSGYDADGMPALNLSVVGFPGDDVRVLALAHAYERQSMMFRFPPVR